MLVRLGFTEEALGWLGESHCERCGGARHFGVVARYGYVRLLFLFGSSVVFSYQATCSVCGLSRPVPREEVSRLRHAGKLADPSVPPLTFYWLVGLSCIFAALCLLIIFGKTVIITACLMLAAVVVGAVVKGVRRAGARGYTRELIQGERPISLFDSVGGLAPKVSWWKCGACGLNNHADAGSCERCNRTRNINP